LAKANSVSGSIIIITHALTLRARVFNGFENNIGAAPILF